MNHKKNNKKVDFENVNNNSLSNDSINNSSIGMPFKIYDDKSGNDNSHAVLKDINQEDFLKELNRIQNFLNDDSLNLNHDEEKLIKEDLKIITDAVNNNNLSVDGFEDVSVEVEDVSIEEMYEVTDCIFRDGGVTGDSSYESFYNYANFSPSVDDRGTLITNPTNASINYYANIGSATDLFNFIPLFVVEFDVVSVIGDLSHQSIQILEKGSTPFIRTFSDLGITDECHVKITVTGIHIIYQVDDNNPIIESYTTTHARLSIILSKGSLKYKDFEIRGTLPEIIDEPVVDDVSFGSVDEEFIFEKSSDLDDMNTLVDDDSQEIAIKVDNVTMEYKITKEKIDTIKTCQNKNGIFGISLDPKTNIIAYPSVDVGKIIIKNYDEKKNNNYCTIEINAHQTEIIALAMNNDGSLVASASEKGTIIKIFKTKDSALIQELRRGTSAATIYSLAFDDKSKYIACSSNKGTVHIFNVKSDEQEVQNQKSYIGSVANFFGIQNEYLN